MYCSEENCTNNRSIELSIGYDLILFMNQWHYLLNPIQSMYFYYEHEESQNANWEFKSLNPENNLILTRGDLFAILEK